MAQDYKTFATAAKEVLGNHIYVCASQLISGLVKNAEHFSEWQDELYGAASIETVAEGRYRICQPSFGVIRVVEVTSSDQDDEDVAEYTEVLFSAFAQWLWDRITETAQVSWRDRAKVPNFDPAIEEHQDMLFAELDAHPGTASGLLPYLKEQESWSHYWTLLDEGDDPEMVDREVYEHWIVSRDAKRDLESVGERVIEIMDLDIWCRTCTGQSFWYDGCMRQLGERYLNH